MGGATPAITPTASIRDDSRAPQASAYGDPAETPTTTKRSIPSALCRVRDIIGPAEHRSVRRELGQPESRPFKNDDPKSEFICEFFATHSHQPRAGTAMKRNNGAAIRIAPLGEPDRAATRHAGRSFAPRTNIVIHQA